MKGDLQVLLRIEKRDRRLERHNKILKTRLSKTRRNRSKSYKTVHAHCYSPTDFAKVSEIKVHQNTLASRRRLLRGKVGGKRAFNVSELVDELEEVSALVVSSRGDCGPEQIAATATKTELANHTLSDARVCLFSDDTHNHMLHKLHLEDGQQIFYVVQVDVNESDHACPWSLGLDSHTYCRIRYQAAKMQGLELLIQD
jgi:hypothetical protein